jgi:hypothetical protein
VTASTTATPREADDVRLGHRFRRFIEWLLPWFDPKAEAQRRAETEEVRLRSMHARIAVETSLRDVPKRYGRFDDVVRR